MKSHLVCRHRIWGVLTGPCKLPDQEKPPGHSQVREEDVVGEGQVENGNQGISGATKRK